MNSTADQIREAAEIIARNMLEGQKEFTIFQYGEMGGITAYQVKATDVEIIKWAQYDCAMRLTYIPKGKRKERQRIFRPGQCLIIWHGWREVDTEFFGKPEVNESTGTTVRRSLGLSHSDIYRRNALKSVHVEPLVSIGTGISDLEE